MMQKYVNNIENALDMLQHLELVRGYQKDGEYWVVTSKSGHQARMTQDVTIGYIEGVLSQNPEVL